MATKQIAGNGITATPPRFAGGPYVLATAAVVGSALLRLAVDPFAHDEAPLLIFAFGVVIAGLYGGFSAGIAATILSVPVADYLFIQPRYTFFVYDPPSQSIMLIAFALLGLLLSGIIERLNRAREHLRRTTVDLTAANAQLVENDRQLAKSEERFRMATEAANEAIWEWNLETRTVVWSETYAKNYGRPSAAEPGMEWWKNNIHPEERESVVVSLRAAVDGTGDAWASEYRFRRVDGTWAHIYDRARIARNADGSAWRAIGAMLDVTETVLARKALQDSEVRLATLAAMVPEILYTAAPNGTPDYVSRRFAEYSGQPVEELQGQGWLNVVHPDDRQLVASTWMNSVQSGTEYEANFRLRRADGSYRWFQGHAVPMLSPEGEVQKWFGIFADIHDRKVMELELSKQTAQLLGSNKLLNQFAYAVSHDLQEPLRMIGSYTQLLARRNEGKLGADSDQFIRFVMNGVDRMRRLIHDLLEYSRTGNEPVGDKVATDATLILGLALQQLQLRIKESGARITFDKLPTVVANQDLLLRVFQNVIGNAIKYSDERPAEIHVSCHREATEWVFSVKDNGIGIDPQYHDRIFEPFQRLQHGREYTGTGVGLAICRQIVERHGGRMWVESAEGNGSTFMFTIPVSQVTDVPLSPEDSHHSQAEALYRAHSFHGR
jgi:two-component system, chemotaxis family, CheB/CheR fusion protein